MAQNENVCERCGKPAADTVQLSTPDGRSTPRLCGECFRKAGEEGLQQLALRVAFERLQADMKFLEAVHEALHDVERELADFIKGCAGDSGEFETLMRQNVTRAMVGVQGSQNRLTKAIAAMMKIVPEPAGEPAAGLFDGEEKAGIVPAEE